MVRVFVFLLVAALVLPGAARALTIDKVVTDGGIEAWLVQDHTNPIIAVDIMFRGGASLDPKGKEGLAHLLASTMDEGAKDLDSQTFQQMLVDRSITLKFSASKDRFSGELVMLTEERDVAFDLLAKALTMPRFDPEPVERIRGQIIAGLKAERTDPDTIAALKMTETLFPDHPYGRPTKGTVDSMAAITVDDLRGYLAQNLTQDNLAIGVVGNIYPDELLILLETTFGRLPVMKTGGSVAETAPTNDGKIHLVELDVPQSSILFTQPGIKRDDPDFYAALILNYVLGGGSFSSRLYSEVREKRGLAYSVYSYLHPLDRAGLISGGAGTANERAADTVNTVRKEWTRMARRGITKQEMEDAKTYITGSYPLRFTSSAGIAGILSAVMMEKLGIDYINNRNELINAVTLEQVNALAKTLLQPDKLTFFLVGKPEGLNKKDIVNHEPDL